MRRVACRMLRVSRNLFCFRLGLPFLNQAGESGPNVQLLYMFYCLFFIYMIF